MAIKTLAEALLIIFIISPLSGGFLNIEELKTIHYGIQILNVPVEMGQAADGDVMVLSSKHGQRYQCTFPDHSQQEKQKEEEEKVAIETGIPELLRPLENSPCLIYRKDWWTYEFCYGKFIKQYHMEDGKPVGVEIYLGHYESEFDWNNETMKKDAKNRLNRYHSQQYVNGTNCDLTGVPRRSEVRFLCDEGTGDHIVSVHEPQTCVYTIGIHTNKICHHPYLRSPSSHKPLPITCNPLLTADQFIEYTQEQEKRKKAEELKHILDLQMAEMKKKRLEEEMREMEKLQQEASTMEPVLVTDTQNTLEEKLTKAVTDLLTKKFEKRFGLSHGAPDMRQIQDLADFEKFVSNYFHLQDGVKDSGQEQEVDSKENDAKEPQVEEKKEGSFDGEEHQIGDNNEIDDDVRNERTGEQQPKSTGGDRLKSPKGGRSENLNQDSPHLPPGSNQDNLNQEKPLETPGDSSNMPKGDGETLINGLDEETQQFYKNLMNVIQQANKKMGEGDKKEKKETEEEGEDVTILEEFSKGLDELGVNTRDDTGRSNLVEGIREAMTAQFDEIVEEAERELADQGEDVQGLDRDLAVQSLSTTLSKLLKTINDKTHKEGDKLEGTESAGSLKDQQQSKGEDRWRVKVSQGKRSGFQDSATDPVTQKLQHGIQEQLQKAGIDTGGRKIEVKIITTGYYNPDDDSIHMLSDDESKAINKMVIAILGTDNDAVDEAEKHSQQEENYHFVYGKQSKKSTKNKDESIDNLFYGG